MELLRVYWFDEAAVAGFDSQL